MTHSGKILASEEGVAAGTSAQFPPWHENLFRRDLVRFAVSATVFVLDAILILFAELSAASLRYDDVSAGTLGLLIVLIPSYFLSGLVTKAFSVRYINAASRSIARCLGGFAITAIVGLMGAFAFKASSNYSRLETVYLLGFGFVYLGFGRLLVASLLKGALRWSIDPVVFILTDGTATLEQPDNTLARTIDIRAEGWLPDHENPDFLERVYFSLRGADRVLLLFADRKQRKTWIDTMRLCSINAEVIEPSLHHIVPLGIAEWNGAPSLVVSRGPLAIHERALKRLFDLVLALACLPVIAPLLAICAVLIKLESPGPVFFVQQRLGRNNRRYRCYKLRTMRAENVDAVGTQSTMRDDRRLTKIGGFLRRTSIDELPQLINVLKGDMSLVGPRPQALGSRAEGGLFWEIIPGYWARHAMKPGMTGLAQVRGLRGPTQSRTDIERRVAADLEYINTWSLWLDLRILLKTLSVIVHHNAY